MPGFLGGGSSGSGGSSELSFPKEFIDPVTKLRVSQPENLIDTDFEYGLQPTKWETVELINNTPSFFSKSGDTTIPNIESITTIVGSREITVKTSLDHGLAAGIPINVSGTKEITADGSYIINSIPNARTFTYLARENQFDTQSIEDLYTSIITGEFFQGSQIRISDSEGIVTDAEPISTLTIKTDSPHGFGPNTPFYFINLNSTITQEFDSTNTESKSFDSSNNATARVFDGSNTASESLLDLSNRAASSPVSVASTVAGVDTESNTITVTHASENFVNLVVGSALQYNVSAAAGFFSTNPRGVVFIKEATSLGSNSSTFSVSQIPNGTVIDIISNVTGTFQKADLVASFAGSNLDTVNQISHTLAKGQIFEFDGDNSEGTTYNITSIAGSGITNFTMNANTGWTNGQMLFYSTTGSAANGLTNNTTYFIAGINAQTNILNLSAEPGGSALSAISGGSGTQSLKAISVSLDKNIVAVPGHNFEEADMVKYAYPEDGAIVTEETAADYYFVEKVYDFTHISLTRTKGFVLDGTTEARAASSAAEILAVAPSSPDGSYWIKPEGSSTAYLTHCIFSLESGGWNQIMKLSSNTMLTNSLAGGTAPQSGSAYTFGPHWDGWAWNQDSQFTTLFPLANSATLVDVDAFSPLFYQLPFNDVMVLTITDTTKRVGWRHNVTIPNMRAVTGGTNQSTYADSWLFPTAYANNQDEWSWLRRLGVHSGVAQWVTQTSPTRVGFKQLADYANNYSSINSYITGGFTTTTSFNSTGHGVAMIGIGGPSNAGSRWGGGIGFSYTANVQWRAHGHWWGQGYTSGATNNRTFLNLAVYVR